MCFSVRRNSFDAMLPPTALESPYDTFPVSMDSESNGSMDPDLIKIMHLTAKTIYLHIDYLYFHMLIYPGPILAVGLYAF